MSYLHTLIRIFLYPFKVADGILALLASLMIRFYQKTLSPDHGPLKSLFAPGVCRYHPTCSMYALDSLRTKGFVRSLPLIVWRILRCNPWSRGGYDPVKK